MITLRKVYEAWGYSEKYNEKIRGYNRYTNNPFN